MHRKKIGLSRKIKSPKQKTGDSKSRKEDIVTFIRSNFKRKECVNYVHNPDGDTRYLVPTSANFFADLC